MSRSSDSGVIWVAALIVVVVLILSGAFIPFLGSVLDVIVGFLGGILDVFVGLFGS